MIEKTVLKQIETEALERYTNRYKKFGVDARSLGWGSSKDQKIRFEVIYRNFDLEGKTIMDVGCGLADLYVYLKTKGVNINYIGVDAIPDFVEYCKKQYPEQSFFCTNVMYDLKLPNPDVVIALGLLNFKLHTVDNFLYTKMFLKRMFDFTKAILITDFISTYRTPEYPKEDHIFYHAPESVFEFSQTLTSNIRIYHDYKPNPQKEFMIALFKGESND